MPPSQNRVQRWAEDVQEASKPIDGMSNPKKCCWGIKEDMLVPQGDISVTAQRKVNITPSLPKK
jgi:hypothetical protein